MNRYQFEDLISEYIENELTISKRKLFESYLEDNPDAKDLVESVRINQGKMKSLPKVSSSSDFNTRLLAKIQKRASRVGFDWSSIEGYFKKIEEEHNGVDTVPYNNGGKLYWPKIKLGNLDSYCWFELSEMIVV